MINTATFYSEYSGHDTDFLKLLHDELRRSPAGTRAAIFLAGDSSLDNKYWFNDRADALNGYERVLNPPYMKQDVAYWLNAELVRRGLGNELFCLNAAVEASSLNSRSFCSLLPQDRLIRDNITSRDYVIISVGGNDLALTPVLATVANLVPLLCCTPQWCIDNAACACPPNLHVDLGCCGCGLPGCLVSPFGCPPGLAYFVDLFGNRVRDYVLRMLGGARPKQVVVCAIYYLDVHGRGSWADCFLQAMCYDCAPSRLQSAIRQVFELATRRIRIPGVDVHAFPLFEVLDGSDTRDYAQRVEPSPRGGAKMAAGLCDALFGSAADGGAVGAGVGGAGGGTRSAGRQLVPDDVVMHRHRDERM